MRFCVVNLGCKVNRVESDAIVRQLREAGATESPEDTADLIVINSCTVTGEADRKTRKATRHALRVNRRADVVVTGCAAAISGDDIASIDARVHVVLKPDMGSYLADCASGHGVSAEDAERRPKAVGPVDRKTGDSHHMRPRTRVGVKIQDGCDHACTYCIVRVARGRAVSRDAEDIVAECMRLADGGVREIILVGINVGSYASGRLNLAHLLEQLLDRTARLCTGEEHPVRFRLSSIEPMDVDDDLVSLIVDAQGRVCRHLHLPLQSGSSKVLHEMARPYDAPVFCGLVERLRAALPGLALTTDVIAGFPGEGDVDFEQTCEVARTCAFSKMHVFPYSPRRGTPAARRDDQVPPEVRADRAARLRALSDELRAAEREARRGTQELAIVLDEARALTESYFEIAPPGGTACGRLVPCLL